VHIVADSTERRFFITGHPEYDRATLANEYFRDREKGIDIQIPANYFPNGDENALPYYTWRAHANLFFANWLNYCVYQKTPYDLRGLTPI
jgi:homoserine O-succinyltransferase